MSAHPYDCRCADCYDEAHPSDCNCDECRCQWAAEADSHDAYVSAIEGGVW